MGLSSPGYRRRRHDNNGFPSKLFMVFADFDAMIGADFERGLRNLAKAVELR